MDLRSGTAFWPTKDGILANYPQVEHDLKTDILVLGAGITGALITYLLAKEGATIVTVDSRDVARGSTSASTGLLQYEIDTHLTDLISKVGKDHAERAYILCLEAIDKVKNLTLELGHECGYKHLPSLYYASSKPDAKALAEEYKARKQIGIALELWDAATLKERFGFSAPAALYSKNGAQINPYRMTHELLRVSQTLGAHIFDQTDIKELKNTGSSFEAKTTEGQEIKANKVIFATGYESQCYLKTRVVDLRSSYAIVSEPVETFWPEKALIWESARPYLYVRSTEDQRILVGGEDIPFRNPKARDVLIERKAQRLETKFKTLFPSLPFRTAYSWTGTFGETKDGLAYIGENSEYPNAYFALGYGGNGIIYSMIGAEIIRDLYLGKTNQDSSIFRFGR
jgi:glycine/D-amino acid oxidase-like deaminating enzyme